MTQPKLQVVEGHEPEPGACGKPSALVLGYERCPPTTDWVLFVDADVVLEPGAVAALLAEARRAEADLVTVIPTVTLTSALERLVMPAVGAVILAHHPPPRVNDPKDAKAFANGQVILTRRQAYESWGGHRAVLHEVLEDVALARLAKASGARLRVVDGRHLATTRMYASWAELSEGWIKNLFLLLDRRPTVALGWALLTLVVGSLGWAALFAAPGPFGLAAFLGIVMMQATLRYLGGAPVAYALGAPVGAAVATYLVIVSTWRHLRGRGVAWKGRHYDASR